MSGGVCYDLLPVANRHVHAHARTHTHTIETIINLVAKGREPKTALHEKEVKL